MTRFVRSVAACFLAVVLLGGVVLVLSGPVADAGSEDVGQAVHLSQVDDDEATTADDAPAVAVSLSPIERLLAQLAPADGATALPAAQRVVLSRDPFAPVVVETTDDGTGDGTDGDGADGGTDGGGTDGGGTDGDGTDGGGSDGGGVADGGDACTGDEQEAVCDGVVVTLDGFTEAGGAIVTVDGTSFTVGVGDEFATSFRVLAVNDPCVTLLFGDEAFSICEGATVLK